MNELYPDEFVSLAMDRLAQLMSNDIDSHPELPWSMKLDTSLYLAALQRVDPKRISFDPNLKYLHYGTA